MNDGMKKFEDFFPVPQETKEKLICYEAMLKEWNEKFNLVAESTLADIWVRHFLDSAQATKYLPARSDYVLADLGSGAGFPGLVLSIMGAPDVHLIESIKKKADFLTAVIEKLELCAHVHNERIESMRGFKVDVITARALKAAPELFVYANQLMKKESFCIFLKGRTLDTELTDARKKWNFVSERFDSLSDSSGSVLVVRHLEWKGSTHGRRRDKK